MNWRYKCVSCKKHEGVVETAYAKTLDSRKKLDDEYDKKNKIAWIVCGNCIEKGKRAGHYFPKDEKQLKKQPRVHLIIYGSKGKHVIDFVYPYKISKTKCLYVEVAKTLAKFRSK